MRQSIRVVASLSLPLCALLPLGCGNGGGAKTKAPAAAAATAQAGPAQPFVPLEACSLLTKAEAESLAGTPVMEPARETAGNLSTCYFGVPGSPMAGSRPINTAVKLTVFTGMEGAYYAGATAQARDGYEQTRKNADAAEPVAGLGESAYWNKDFKSLEALKGKYWLTVDAEGGLETAKKVMAKAIAKLP